MSIELVQGNVEADFDETTRTTLNSYVYALRDPRDRKVFYIGKAGGNNANGNDRVLHHFEGREGV